MPVVKNRRIIEEFSLYKKIWEKYSLCVIIKQLFRYKLQISINK